MAVNDLIKKEKVQVLMPHDAKELLKELYLFRSYSGFEEPLRCGIMNYLDKLNVPYINYNGNILGFNHPGKPLFSAHMDMVNTESWKLKGQENAVTDAVFTIDDKACLRLYRGPQKDGHQTSLGADDKNGIWVILMLLREGFEINFAFCHSEEVGGIGSSQIIADKECAQFVETCKFGIIIDRRNAGDIIGYDNKYCMALDDRLEAFSNEQGFGYKCARGSVSDADKFSTLIECVNLSCGYYEPHTSREYTNLNELWNTFQFCKKILTDFEYTSVSPKRMQSFKNCRSPYVSTIVTTTTAKVEPKSDSVETVRSSFYGRGYYGSSDYESRYITTKGSDTSSQKKTSEKETKTMTTTATTTTSKDTTDSDDEILEMYMQDAIDLASVYVPELDVNLLPLFSDSTLPDSTALSDIIHYETCSKCKTKLMLLQDSVDELFVSYQEGFIAEKTLGMCTECGNTLDISNDMKYLL